MAPKILERKEKEGKGRGKRDKRMEGGRAGQVGVGQVRGKQFWYP